LLREELQTDTRFTLVASELAKRDDILRIHDLVYVDGFLNGTLENPVMRRIGFPWSPELVTRTLASAGATLSATRTALSTGVSGTLAGGTHHASRNEGSGFCVFNDLAISLDWARSERGIGRAAVIDLDVHQGDGTAAIFEEDPAVFTLSLHGAKNFPFRKRHSTLDVELEDFTNDEHYLAVLEPALEKVWQFAPELIIFQAGVDTLKADRLGRLGLTREGLRKRDLLVLRTAAQLQIPIVITIGGGYSEPIDETVQANAQTFRTAAEVFSGLIPTEVGARAESKSFAE
jgi:acetoin utilization deacetylase AcuC-like enzyme